MSRTLMNGVRVPEGTDPFNAQGDMDTLGRSIKSIIWATDWQDAYRKRDRAKWDLGWTATPTDPIFFWVESISALIRYDGTRWDGTGGIRIESQQAGDVGLPYSQPSPNEVMIVKCGRLAGFTGSLHYGHGYMEEVHFPTPFPNACLSIVFQPIWNNAVKWQFTATTQPAVETLTNKGFRIMFPGENDKSHAHALMWIAVGF